MEEVVGGECQGGGESRRDHCHRGELHTSHRSQMGHCSSEGQREDGREDGELPPRELEECRLRGVFPDGGAEGGEQKSDGSGEDREREKWKCKAAPVAIFFGGRLSASAARDQ